MKAALFLTVGSLMGSTFAALHARHADFHNKKRGDITPLDYSCCNTVVTVTVYEDEPTGVPKAQDKALAAKVTDTPAASSSVAPPAASSSAPAASSGGGILTNGNKWAITYTPYDSTGGCKSAGAVASDLAAIKAKGFTTIRTYGTDCSGLSSIGPAARANGLKVILGVFIKSDGIGAAQSQVTDIVAFGKAGNWDLVVMIVVGNEAIFSGAASGPALAAFITSSKAAFQAAGSGSIPVTTSETVATLVANKDSLCPVIDVVGANIHAYFDAGVSAGSAGSHILTQLGLIEAACPGKPSYNLETGWPSGGGSNGAAIASPDAQAAAIGDILAKAGQKSVVFSFTDDAWKAPGVEQHFGCSQLF